MRYSASGRRGSGSFGSDRTVTCDRLHNREGQSLSQVSQLATAFPTPTSSHNLGRRQNDQIWFKKINDY